MKTPSYCPHCGDRLRNEYIESTKVGLCQNAICGYEFWPYMLPAVAVIIQSQGKYLLTRREMKPEKGRLDWPGGFVSFGETLETAAVREIKEELGLDIEIYKFLASMPEPYHYKGFVQTNLVVAFLGNIVGSNEIIVKEDELQEVLWVQPNVLQKKDFAFESGPVFYNLLSA